MPNDIVCIVGTHPDTRAAAPYNDKRRDIWVFNEAAAADWCKRADAVFQMHAPEIYRSPKNLTDPKHWDWLKQKHDGLAIYMQDVDPEVPNSVKYPLEEICAEFLPNIHLVDATTGFYAYLTCTVAYAIALAIYKNYRRIELYGVELNNNTEYTYQRMAFSFWVGMALGHGVEVIMNCGRHLIASPLYGYEAEIDLGHKCYIKRAEQLDAEWKAINKNLHNQEDALRRAVQRGEKDKAAELLVQIQDVAIKCGTISGALGENEKYAGYDGRTVYRNEFEIAAALARNQSDEYRSTMYRSLGKAEYLWNVWKQTDNPQAASQFLTFADEHNRAAYDTGARLGIFQENMAYMVEIDERIHAAGNERAKEILEKP